MNSLFESIQSSLTDTIRFSVLHSITTGNTSNNVLMNTILTAIAISVGSYLMNLTTKSFMGKHSAVDMVKSFFFRKCIVRLKGHTITLNSPFNAKAQVSTLYTNDFKAIWSGIIKHICDNPTIYEISEIKNTVRIKSEDSYTQTEGVYIVSQKDHFILDKSLEIYAYTNTHDSSTTNDEKSATSSKTDTYEIVIYSYKNDTATLKKYVDDQTRLYLSELSESRQNKRFLYNLVNNKYSERCEFYDCWRENEFQSSKTFQNVFFENKSQVMDKIHFFMQNREWYDMNGIPYTLGIGLYGPPGTGKTSFIKALTNYMKDRHLVNVPMALIQTKKQLNDFYFEEQYNELNSRHSIDFSKKIIVIEDIDCAGDIVLERSKNPTKRPSLECKMNADDITLSTRLEQMDEEVKKVVRENIIDESRKIISKLGQSNDDDRVSLDDILNLWDGIRETPGRILIISSNHYEKLDSAIRRPGRIDITLELKNASHQVIRDMFMHFYKTPIDESLLRCITTEFYSPAEIANLYTIFRNDMNGFIERLCENRKL